VLRSEIDADQDGRIEKWEFHGPDGRVARVAVSREKNGKADAWIYPGADGKIARAEPIATRMAVGKAFFAGVFPELEAELSGMAAGGGARGCAVAVSSPSCPARGPGCSAGAP